MPKRSKKAAASTDTEVTIRTKRPQGSKAFKKKQFLKGGGGEARIGWGIADALPNKVFYKFRFCATSQPLIITAGAPTKRQYNLNSLFDPDRTGVGHQPYLFDQFSSGGGLGYAKYLVHACKYEVVMESQLQDNTAKGCYDVTAEVNQGGVSDPANCESAIERSDRWIRVHCNNTSGTVGVDVPVWALPRFKGFVKMKNIFGRKLDPSSDGAVVSASPTQEAILNVFAWWPGSNIITATRYCTIRLTYYAEMFNRIQTNTS